MKTTIYLTIITFFVFAFFLPTKGVAQEPFYVESYENIQGFYTPSGNIPTEFKTIDYLELRNGRDEISAFGVVKIKGRGGNYYLLEPKLTDKNISVKTRTVKGISYEFNGMFTRLDMATTDMDPDSKEIFLTGKLKKLKAGKVIAETDVKFTYYVGT
jgi:hypothetical protein